MAHRVFQCITNNLFSTLSFNFSSTHGQGHLPLEQTVQTPVQPGFEHFQGRSINNFSGQPLPLPQHSQYWSNAEIYSMLRCETTSLSCEKDSAIQIKVGRFSTAIPAMQCTILGIDCRWYKWKMQLIHKIFISLTKEEESEKARGSYYLTDQRY